jgi:hypothetical protein
MKVICVPCINSARRSHSTTVWSKTFRWTASLLLAAVLTWCAEVQAVPPDRATEIDKLMTALYERGQFNGAVLVAQQGEEAQLWEVRHVSRTISSESYGKP